MTWTWIRPADPSILAGRPLLDVGTGDGQTLRTLTSGIGLVVGLDESENALRAAHRAGPWPLVRATGLCPPFAGGAFEVVLAGDLFHHFADDALNQALRESRRVLRPDGRLVAWWYERPGRAGAGGPRYPRTYKGVAEAARRAGFNSVEELDLEYSMEPSPPTVGLVARN